MLVDLFTTSRELQDLVIREYTEAIFEKQIGLDNSDPDKKVYWLYELNHEQILRFLKKQPQEYPYELRNSRTGEFVEVNNTSANLNN